MNGWMDERMNESHTVVHEASWNPGNHVWGKANNEASLVDLKLSGSSRQHNRGRAKQGAEDSRKSKQGTLRKDSYGEGEQLTVTFHGIPELA